MEFGWLDGREFGGYNGAGITEISEVFDMLDAILFGTESSDRV